MLQEHTTITRLEAAKRLGVHANTIAAWVRAGRLTSDSAGGIPMAEVERVAAEFGQFAARAGASFTAAERLVEFAGARRGAVLRGCVELAGEIAQLGAEIQARSEAAPEGNLELFATLRRQIAEIAAAHAVLEAIELVVEIAPELITETQTEAPANGAERAS